MKFILFCTVFLNITVLLKCVEYEEKKLDFPSYTYKKSTDLENKYHGRFNRCNMRTDCQNYELEERQNCILNCISPKCYQKIYASNPLEEGEIDQRIQSFKGCLHAELS